MPRYATPAPRIKVEANKRDVPDQSLMKIRLSEKTQ
jgi:hypothetical protein